MSERETVLDADLRERWSDAADGARRLDAARAELESRLAEDDGGPVAQSHVGRARQRLSEACRLSGLLDEALDHKDAAIEIWREQDKFRATCLVELQRALVLAELGRAADSQALFEELDVRIAGDERLEPYYRDFWLEYDARRAAMMGDRALAGTRLQEALDLRRATRAPRIVEWTEYAISKVLSADDSV